MVARRTLVVLLMVIVFAVSAAPVRADGSWLDSSPPAPWNEPGMAVPAAPVMGELLNPRCGQMPRPAETAEDLAVVEAGWALVGSYESGWGVRVVLGASNYDGMCRPLGYQVFVFADGLFAGTVAPVPMDSRTDGAAGPSSLVDGDRLNVTFSRYAPSDPLCCPSRTSSVTYAIDRAGAAPVLRATSVFTTPLSRT